MVTVLVFLFKVHRIILSDRARSPGSRVSEPISRMLTICFLSSILGTVSQVTSLGSTSSTVELGSQGSVLFSKNSAISEEDMGSKWPSVRSIMFSQRNTKTAPMINSNSAKPKITHSVIKRMRTQRLRFFVCFFPAGLFSGGVSTGLSCNSTSGTNSWEVISNSFSSMRYHL